jgi:hypothetical protein
MLTKWLTGMLHLVFKCHDFMTPTRPPLHSSTMFSKHSSLVAASAASANVFHNPHCISRRTSFASKMAFTMHCQRSPACLVFIRDELHGTSATTTTSHSTDVEHNATSVNNPIMTSTKQTSLMCCEVINEQHVGDDTSMEFLLSKLDTNHHDHFHALDEANNHDSDAYEWKGIVSPLSIHPTSTFVVEFA